MIAEVHIMEKTFFEKIGGEFERQGDYLRTLHIRK